MSCLQRMPSDLILGHGPSERQASYRDLFGQQLGPGAVIGMRHPANGNYALSAARFAEDVARAFGRRVVPGQVRQAEETVPRGDPEGGKGGR